MGWVKLGYEILGSKVAKHKGKVCVKDSAIFEFMAMTNTKAIKKGEEILVFKEVGDEPSRKKQIV
jgi:hypothetical protein